jgi:hypothetical protein
MISALISFVLAIFAGWLLYKSVFQLYTIFRPFNQIIVMPFQGADSIKSTSQALLTSRFRSMAKRSSEPPAGYGVFSLPMLNSNIADSDTITNAFQNLDKVTFKIKDVDVGALFRAFDDILSPYSYELRGTVTQTSESTLITARLVCREKIYASWEAESRGGPGDALITQTLDDLVYQVTYDLMTREDMKKFGVPRSDAFANWQGLKNYVEGLSAFKTYQTTHDTNQLLSAYKSFDKLVYYQPDSRLGLYFRGLVESERRREAEAVSDFERLKRLMEPKSTSPTDKSKLNSPSDFYLEAKLNEATSRLKFYRTEEGLKAIKTLKEIIQTVEGEIESKLGENISVTKNDKKKAADIADKNVFLVKMLILTHAQLGYSYGTMLSFLKDEGTSANDPKVQGYSAQFEDSISNANCWLDALSQKDRDSGGQEMEFRILNAEGYGRYRLAFFNTVVTNGLQTLEEKYQNECDRAAKILEQARDLRPDHYEVLQNLGMIYADEKFDPDGNRLARAKELFDTTVSFIPDDYYQYEQLAVIHLRLAEINEDDADRAAAELQLGIKNAELASEKRKPAYSESVLIVESKLRLLAWSLKDKADNTEAGEALKAFRIMINKKPRSVRDVKLASQYIAFLNDMASFRTQSAFKLIPIVHDTALLLGALKGEGNQGEAKELSLDLKKRSDELTALAAKETSANKDSLVADAAKLAEAVKVMASP